MTPREELEELILDADSFDRAAKRTRAFAIGRWVPVEERLPENGARCVVRGHDNKLFCADHFCNGIWDKWEHEPTVTHWLELDLPKQPNEKGE